MSGDVMRNQMEMAFHRAGIEELFDQMYTILKENINAEYEDVYGKPTPEEQNSTIERPETAVVVPAVATLPITVDGQILTQESINAAYEYTLMGIQTVG